MQLTMASSLQPWFLLLLLPLLSLVLSLAAPAAVFNDNFVAVGGTDANHLVNQGTSVRLVLDRSSGTYQLFLLRIDDQEIMLIMLF